MKMRFVKNCAWIGVIVLFFIIYIFSFYQSESKLFYTPDENANYYISQVYANSGSFSYTDPLNQNLSVAIVHPREIFPYNGKLVPKHPLGGPLMWGTYLGSNLPEIIVILIPLAGILCILFVLLLARSMFSASRAIFSALLVGIVAPVWFFSTSVMLSDILWIFFAIAGLRYLFKAINEKSSVSWILMGLFFATSLLIDYKSIFFIFSAGISAIIVLFNKRTLNVPYLLRAFFYTVCGSLLTIMTFFITNKMTYGGYLITGYRAVQVYASSLGGPELSLFYLELPKMLSNLVYYGWYIPSFTVMVVFGIYYTSRENYGKSHILTWWFIVYALIAILYLSNIATAGSGAFNVQSSYFRYLLPIFLLTGPFVFAFLKKYPRAAVLFILYFVVFNILTVVFSTGGIHYYDNYKQNSLSYRDKVIASTENDSIIITTYYDKILFPYRKVADVSLLTEEDSLSGENIDEISLARVISELRVPTYIAVLDSIDSNRLTGELIKYNLTLRIIKDRPLLYQVVSENP
jgi:hypothetical protein